MILETLGVCTDRCASDDDDVDEPCLGDDSGSVFEEFY